MLDTLLNGAKILQLNNLLNNIRGGDVIKVERTLNIKRPEAEALCAIGKSIIPDVSLPALEFKSQYEDCGDALGKFTAAIGIKAPQVPGGDVFELVDAKLKQIAEFGNKFRGLGVQAVDKLSPWITKLLSGLREVAKLS